MQTEEASPGNTQLPVLKAALKTELVQASALIRGARLPRSALACASHRPVPFLSHHRAHSSS